MISGRHDVLSARNPEMTNNPALASQLAASERHALPRKMHERLPARVLWVSLACSAPVLWVSLLASRAVLGRLGRSLPLLKMHGRGRQARQAIHGSSASVSKRVGRGDFWFGGWLSWTVLHKRDLAYCYNWLAKDASRGDVQVGEFAYLKHLRQAWPLAVSKLLIIDSTANPPGDSPLASKHVLAACYSVDKRAGRLLGIGEAPVSGRLGPAWAKPGPQAG
jgi:hypothetical protein